MSKGSKSRLSFNIKQLAKFIKVYKTHHNVKTAGRNYIEWLTLAAGEFTKANFPSEDIMSITITDKARKCLEK